MTYAETQTQNKEAEQFKKQGYFHGKGFFSVELVDRLKAEFDHHFRLKQERFRARLGSPDNRYGANHDIQRWNMLLPSEGALLTSNFFADPAIFSVVSGIFEGPFSLVFLSSDISAPGSAFQTIHQDGNDFAVALNLPLVDADEVNGSTQIFPNTHRTSESSPFNTLSNSFSDQDILDRASTLMPMYMNVAKGDYTLRDLRLIHRGTPNNSDQLRPYLSAIFAPSESEEAPTFDCIHQALETFESFKTVAFKSGSIKLIDFANTFGRMVMLSAQSDRVKRPIPKHVSDRLSEESKYVLRFAKFEDEILQNRVVRTSKSSQELYATIEECRRDFDALVNTH
jgi:hypothetical protein